MLRPYVMAYFLGKHTPRCPWVNWAVFTVGHSEQKLRIHDTLLFEFLVTIITELCQSGNYSMLPLYSNILCVR